MRCQASPHSHTGFTASSPDPYITATVTLRREMPRVTKNSSSSVVSRPPSGAGTRYFGKPQARTASTAPGGISSRSSASTIAL
ncbi:hypothetical protein LUX57_20145 [Actinomadura madurae]|uniref:hypothetical protein n=1 Tax=Actinomadura madurae TaxID=1993 RepID=UPI0020D20811|nr:hypothetical protein [Actinomadura madurae]MCP9967139.1 hypothetical protein [Actinomadura madurae]